MVQGKNERRSNISSPPARPATALRHQGLRQELIAAAEGVIETQGLEHLRARDLAVQAGCSVGAIYNVFTDLDWLVLEVNANTLRAIGAKMATISGAEPLACLLRLADAYLDYAVDQRRRWDALFNHQMPLDAETPEWFEDVQNEAFSYIEAPLARLRPDLPAPALGLLGRSIFAAVHGMVALGLDKRVGSYGVPVLRSQIGAVVRAIAAGLPKVDLDLNG
jgi:AcrR family transcriptional regulator